MSTMSKIMAYEDGELDENETVAMFQELINSGVVWSLQGSYGRIAQDLIDNGYCTKPEEKPAASSGNFGPYVGVKNKVSRAFDTPDGKRTFTILTHEAYNACGLVGYECNGIAVLDDDNMSVVADGLEGGMSGWGGIHAHTLASFQALSTADWPTFRSMVNSSRRLRYAI